MKVRWQVFPKYLSASAHQIQVIEIFDVNFKVLGTPENGLKSNEVLSIVCPGLELIGYQVEGVVKVVRPVLFGESGKITKSYNVDGWDDRSGTVLEVEAGQTIENNRFALDIFKACSIQSARNLILAVPASYHPERLRNSNKPPKKPFDDVIKHVDSLYSSNRMELPLDSILVIGY